MIVYQSSQTNRQYCFSETVIEHFGKFQQSGKWKSEAGGQLFGKFIQSDVNILEATGPRKSDIRSRHRYLPNRRAEKREISSRHKIGLHYAGEWHTHPQDIPIPSQTDIDSMQNLFRKSIHQLDAFVLVIVGTGSIPETLSVSIFDGISVETLEYIKIL